jgi:hypothetical protein
MDNELFVEELSVEELSVEELGEVAGANTLGTGSTISTPASSASTIGCH